MADVGLTLIELPVPAGVPVQLPVNHCQLAPLPRLPPVTFNVVLLPEQIVVAVEAVIPLGAALFVFTLITVETQAVLPQAPSALT